MITVLAAMAGSPVAPIEPPPDPFRPARQRTVLGLTGATAMAAGAIWYFKIGDSLGAGDPALMLGMVGFVATVGAVSGSGVTRFAPDESDLEGEASTPVLRTGLSYGGAAWARERVGHGIWWDLRPRLQLGRVRITPGVTVRQQLGSSQDVDWRGSGDFGTALEQVERGLDADVEVRGRVGPHVDVIANPIVRTRWERFTYQDGSERKLQRSFIVPMSAGFRWRISGRQYFETIAGPRWDALGWGDGRTPLFASQIFFQARYRIQLAHPEMFGALVRSRVGFGYQHGKFEGVGYNVVASIGFTGPFLLDYDVRFTPRKGPAVQVGVDLSIADNGGFGFEVGLAPRGSRP